MRTESLLPTMEVIPRSVTDQLHLHGWNWRSSGAVCGFCFGIICPVVGSVLTVIAWFTGPFWHGFFIQRDGTTLLFLTIPLLMFGAHCLDLLDQEDEGTKSGRLKSSAKR